MKVAFVQPSLDGSHSRAAMEVLCFAILKALTPPDVEICIHDERLGPVPFDETVDLVAITVETFTARRAYQIAANYRRRGVPVVLGGFHPTFLPGEARRFADAVVVGDAETAWPQVLADARAGRLKPLYRSAEFAPMAGVVPDRSVFAGKRYLPIGLVQCGRGCRFNCSYCSIHAFYGRSIRHRPVHEIVTEIEQRQARHYLFVDDNLYHDTEQFKTLLRALIPLRIRWSCQSSLDVARDTELLRLMKRSGCSVALLGFDTLDPGNLRAMKKAWNRKWASYDTSIARIQDAGLMIYGTFVFGYDGDTPDSFDRTVEFAIRNKFVLAGFNPLTPTPGTRVHDELSRQGRMIYERWWLDPRYRYRDAVFQPRGMTATQLEEGCYRARTAFSSYGSILSRVWDQRTNLRSAANLLTYTLTNQLTRREIREKEGHVLGVAGAMDPFEQVRGAALA
jgi:radical SAM superfamily enzyme YgiQ (UPF0313 family)